MWFVLGWWCECAFPGGCNSYVGARSCAEGDEGSADTFQSSLPPPLLPRPSRYPEANNKQQDKRDYVVERLRAMGFVIKQVPDSTFYLWLDLEGLPDEIADGLNFFQVRCSIFCFQSWLENSTAFEMNRGVFHHSVQS